MRLRATVVALATMAGVLLVVGPPSTAQQEPRAGTPREARAEPPRACGSSFARTNDYRKAARKALTQPRLERSQGQRVRQLGRCLPPRATRKWKARVKGRWHRWRKGYPVWYRLEFEREYAGLRSTLEAIAACESDGNPGAVSSTGTYRGKYQFSYATWATVGGSGDPAATHVWEQDYRAAVLYMRSGPGQWPICGA